MGKSFGFSDVRVLFSKLVAKSTQLIIHINRYLQQKINKLKCLIFDIDGTLTNTTAIDDKCYIKAFESVFSVNINDVNWVDLKNVTDWGITEELFKIKFKRDISNEELNQLKEKFIKYLSEEFINDKSQFIEIPGATAFFKKLLNNQKYEIGIATGGWEESANLKLKAIGINPYSVSYSNSNKFKTREDITLDVIAQIKIKTIKSADEIVYFGDGEWDYITCQKLGINFIGIDSKLNKKLAQLGVKEIHTDFVDHNKIMKSILNSSK